MKSKIFKWGLILVLGSLLLLRIFKSKESPGPAIAGKPGAGMVLPVEALLIKTRTLDNVIRVSGTLLANEEVQLQCESPGKVTAIYFEEGKPVRKGQLLLKLNDALLQAALKKAESKLKLAEDMEKRERALLKKEGISQAEYEQSLNELNASRAELMQIKEQIRQTELLAPFDGVLGLKYISEGAYVSAGSRIASLQNIERIKLQLAVPERYAGRLHRGSKLHFKTEGNSKVYEATVYAIEPNVDEQTRNISFRAMCENDGKLFPGAYASVELSLDAEQDAIMIPSQAVIPVLKGQKVFVLRGDSAVEQKIETGLRTDTELQVKEGLKAGDTLITTAMMQLKNGSKVKLLKLKQ